MTKPRVLLIAEAANPDWTSVPLVGWSHARALMERVDATLVTQVRNVEAIDGQGLVRDRDYFAIDSEAVARPIWRLTDRIQKLTGLGWTFGTATSALSYYAFERTLWKRFGPSIEAGEFDIVHRLTPLSPTTPSLIAARCARAGVPFVLGPLNGGVPWPPGFADVQRKEGEWLHHVRDAYRLLPGYRKTYSEAAAVLVASRATHAQLPESCRDRAVYIPENAIDPERFDLFAEGPIRTPLRVAFVGRLVPYKGADMLIEATAELIRAGRLRLDIIGDGPDRGALEALARDRGVAADVRLDGWVPHRELASRLVESDVFGFPSVREFGGGVVLEAMALGLVPVVADYAGPAELVTDETGVRVPIGTREEVVAGFRRAFERLVDDPEPLREMGRRGRDRVMRLFTWTRKAEQVHRVYDWVLGRAPKPDFGMPLVDVPASESEAGERDPDAA